MPRKWTRRDFGRLIVVSAGVQTVAGCTEDEEAAIPPSTDPADVLRVYPQGLASGDPKSDRVILWTRVDPAGVAGAIPVHYEVAADEAFGALVATGDASVDESTDHTLRLQITGLSPYTVYFYRFIASNVLSVTGRTKTAPAAGQDVDVRFAFAACQDFNGRYYHAWRALLDEDDVDFVLFLGDYVYETEADPRFQEPTDERRITVPDGLPISEDEDAPYSAAITLADYRSLYKQYRGDADLRAVHSRYPFITVWDDHEFADDSWQDHATHFNDAQGDEKDSERRHAASKAWFEYQPMDVPFSDTAAFPDDITIYRDLRYGKRAHFVLTDQRYYRDDHVVAEGPANFDVAKFEMNSGVGSRNFVLKSGFDPLEAAATPTLLGADQKSWLVETLSGSDATWKFWCNQTQLAQMALDLSSFDDLPAEYQNEFYFTVDQWDGFRTERAEVISQLAGVTNLVGLAGDIHAFYAAHIHVDFDTPAATPALVEYTVAGISSLSAQGITQAVVEGNPTLSGLGLLELVPQFDTLLKAASPHYVHANSLANGIALVDVAAGEIVVTFLEVNDVTDPTKAGVKSRTTFRTQAGSATIEPL